MPFNAQEKSLHTIEKGFFMSLPPSYQRLCQIPAMMSDGPWRLGRGQAWAWALRVPAQAPSGWRLRLSLQAEDVASAWEALRPILGRYELGGRVALPETALARGSPFGPSTGAMITVFADSIQDPLVAQHLCGAIEDAFLQHRFAPGLPVLADRPISGSVYQSMRCDPPEFPSQEERLDYNALSRAGPFWSVHLPPSTRPAVDMARLLGGILGPAGIWGESQDVWHVEGGPSDLLPFRRALRRAEIPTSLQLQAPSFGCLKVSKVYGSEIQAQWPVLRENVDAYRVSHLLKFPEVHGREADTLPPRVVIPTEYPMEPLLAKLSQGGLSIQRLRNANAEILIPSRALVDRFEAAWDESGSAVEQEETFPKEEIDPLKPAPVDGARVRVRAQPLRRVMVREYDPYAIAASIAAVRKQQGREKDKESALLKNLGITSVSMRTGLDRVMMQREREKGNILEEDPRALLEEIGQVLQEASHMEGQPLSQEMHHQARGVGLAIGAMTRRPDLSMNRAFTSVKKVEGLVSGVSRQMAVSNNPRASALAQRLDSLAWRARARATAGPPKTHLALTPEEVARLRKQAQRG